MRFARNARLLATNFSVGIPIGRFGEPEEVAATMLFIVCEASYATGSGFPIDSGILSGIGFEG